MDIETDQIRGSIEDQLELATRARIAEIGARSRRRLGELAGQFARAAGTDRERLLAEIEFERWLAEGCGDDLL